MPVSKITKMQQLAFMMQKELFKDTKLSHMKQVGFSHFTFQTHCPTSFEIYLKVESMAL